MDIFFTTLLCLFLSFIFLIFHFLFYKSKHAADLPPGSTGWPVIGETFEFLSTGWKGHPEKFIFDRMAKYSSLVFRTHIIGEPAAVFCGPACNKFLYSNENKLVQAWWPNSVYKIFPSSSQTSSQEESIRMRKLLPNFLKAEALRQYVGVMDRIARRHFADHWETKHEVVVNPLAKDYTFWIASSVFVSVEDPIQVRELSEPFNLIPPGVLSVPIDLPGTPFNKAIKASNSVREKLLSIIKRRKVELSEGRASATQDILSHMLVTCDEDGKFMDEWNIADKVLGMLIGGHDTASSVCTFIVKVLAEHPHVYDAVYAEQMEIARSKGEDDESLNWEDLQKMKYSWNVACEVMRIAPPLQGAFREAIADFMYNGYSIPKGWKLYWSANSTHKNSKYFSNPEKFDPSRFEGSGPAPYTYVPFGGGPRMCPGKEYARLEILIFMHHLVKRFKWKKIIPNEKVSVYPMPMLTKGLPIRLYPY